MGEDTLVLIGCAIGLGIVPALFWWARSASGRDLARYGSKNVAVSAMERVARRRAQHAAPAAPSAPQRKTKVKGGATGVAARCYLPGANDDIAVARKLLLTPNEQEFWARLQKGLPDYDVLPQVAMGALVQNAHQGDWATIKAFQAKICDFVVYSKKPRGVAVVIELDDKTHDRNKDASRDALLASAGIPTVRFESRNKPSAEEIRRIVLDVIAQS